MTCTCGPGELPLCLYRGDTARFRFRLWADAGMTVPTDLTGATVKAEIRDRPAGGLLLCAMEIVVTLPNVIDATLTAEECDKAPVRGAWDLQVDWPGIDVTTVLAGPVATYGDVTDTHTVLGASMR